jgi:hypothetical protein
MGTLFHVEYGIRKWLLTYGKLARHLGLKGADLTG